jgi:hypothetical protein
MRMRSSLSTIGCIFIVMEQCLGIGGRFKVDMKSFSDVEVSNQLCPSFFFPGI